MDERNICRVCGYKLDFMIWGEDGKTPSYEICPCCGVEFGNEDYSKLSVYDYRKNWIESGCIWFDSHKKPLNWSYTTQANNIPSSYK